MDFTNLIELALYEDLHELGDVTSESIFDTQEHTFYLVSKDEGILCGIDIFREVFSKVDNSLNLEFLKKDGDFIKKSDCIAKISGKVVSILKAERTGINFLSHLSAVSTKTAQFVAVASGKVIILDTRKTTPGFRDLEKYAVRCGGGQNHRTGLYDMVMIKDNHADAAGGITKAVERVRSKWGEKFKIEVECRDLDDVREALACGIDRIMLDNMSNEDMSEAVELINRQVEIEASGNMTIDRIKEVGDLGVDFISFGELTHTIKAFDFSLREEL
ncbi:MAG: carboxylating nicotinate-nucleotide diphosphorylase [Spirochaetales bacterium]|nr:carboxylating nicotinate-nucleotide diphosphorylase [Spirochaetales bacterium]